MYSSKHIHMYTGKHVGILFVYLCTCLPVYLEAL